MRTGNHRALEFNDLEHPRKICWISYNHCAVSEINERYGSEILFETAIEDASTLQKIVLLLESFEVGSVDEDCIGAVFEYFMQDTTETQNDIGEYYTPRGIVRFMVAQVDPEWGKTLYDPFCGTGGFLTESYKHMKRQTKQGNLPEGSIFGGEITTTESISEDEYDFVWRRLLRSVQAEQPAGRHRWQIRLCPVQHSIFSKIA